MPIFPSIVLRSIASMLVVQWAGVMPATAQTSADGVAATAPKLAAGLLERALAPLAQDGPATPEQISLVMPILAEPGERLGTTVRYAADGEEQWREAHPLFRVHPEFAAKGHRVDEVFAGVITPMPPAGPRRRSPPERRAPASRPFSTTRTLATSSCSATAPTRSTNSR